MSATPSAFAGRDRAALRQHLSSYWKMEAANVLAVPVTALILITTAKDRPDIAFWAGALACSFLLVIGTLAWLIVLAQLDGDQRRAARMVAICARAEPLALAVLGVASGAVGLQLADVGWPPRAIAAVVLTTLGWLEYVNYYHWQLQNFDSLIDLRRLLAGRGLRRAHLGRAVRVWRRRRR